MTVFATAFVTVFATAFVTVFATAFVTGLTTAVATGLTTADVTAFATAGASAFAATTPPTFAVAPGTGGTSSLAGALLGRGAPETIEALQTALGPVGVAVFALLTRLGGATTVIPALAVYYWRWGDRDRAAVATALALAALALVQTLKAAFGLPRPPDALHAVPAEGSGFPSGHALGAAAVWGGLAALDHRWSARRRYATAGAVVAAVAVSRVVLGVHYPVDVVAGVAAGLALAAVVVGTCRDRPLVAFGIAASLAGLALVVAGRTVDATLAAGGAVGGAVAWWRLPVRPAPPRVGWPAATAGLATLATGWLVVEDVALPAPTLFVGGGAAVAGLLWMPAAVGRLRARTTA